MKYWPIVVPNAALFILLCRMAAAGLAAARPAVFAFLCIWLIFSLGTLIAGQTADPSGAGYANFYLAGLTLSGVALAPALWRASIVAVGHPAWCIVLAVTGLSLSFTLGLNLVRLTGPTPGWRALIATMFGSLAAAAIFFCAAMHAAAPDRLLWQGLGWYLLIFGAGTAVARLEGRTHAAYFLVAALATLVWLVLAWRIGPHPDVLISLEKLALIPFAFLCRAHVRGNCVRDLADN